MLILPVVALMLVASCATGGVEARLTTGLDVNGAPDVIIENFSGDITITTGGADRIEAEVVKSAPPARGDLLEQMSFEFSADAATVRGVGKLLENDRTADGVKLDLRLVIPAGSNLTVVLGNGRVVYTGAPVGATLYFEVGNGDVTVGLPATQTFRVEANIGNGKFVSDFPLRETAMRGTITVEDTVGAEPALTVGAAIGSGTLAIKKQ